jgi:hypothetical protein
MNRRSTGWKVGTAVLLTATLTPVLLWACVKSAETRRWSDMERDTRALLAAANARSGERPVLRGEPEPGRAWTLYDEAIQGVRSSGLECRIDEDLEEAKVRILLEKCGPALDLLRRGVRRADGQRHRAWEIPEQYKPIDSLLSVAGNRATNLIAGKKYREAAELLMDALQFCGDAGRNGSESDTAESNRCRTHVLFKLQSLILSGNLNSADLLEMERELRILDAALPSLADSERNTAMDTGFMLLDVAPGKSLLRDPSERTWRFAWSEKLMITDAWFTLDRAMKRFAEASRKPWLEALEVERQVAVEITSSRNVLWTQYSRAGFRETMHHRRHRIHQAQIRLLAAAARYRADGSIPDFDDPFGTKLHHLLKEGKLRIWSLGPDGADDVGEGDWDPVPGKNIVVETGR